MIPLVTPPSMTMSQKRSLGALSVHAPLVSSVGRVLSPHSVVGDWYGSSRLGREGSSLGRVIRRKVALLGNRAYTVPRVVTNGWKPVSSMSSFPSRGIRKTDTSSCRPTIGSCM